MCGLLGYSFKKNTISPEIRAVLATNLARYNDDRGGDSWGIAGIKDNKYHITRGIGELSDNAHELCGFDVLFAHTRFATHGAPSVDNAHPFKIGKLIGAHNGMIRNHEELNALYEREFDVDSQHIFAHINAGLPLDELEGYGAIEWIKRDDPNTILLARFRGGELAVYGIGDNSDRPDGIVWSSSFRHLIKALVASGITNYFRYEIRTGRVYEVNNGTFNETDDRLNLAAPAPEPIPAQEDEDEDGPPRHLVRTTRSNLRSMSNKRFNPLTGRKIDHVRLFRKLYASADA